MSNLIASTSACCRYSEWHGEKIKYYIDLLYLNPTNITTFRIIINSSQSMKGFEKYVEVARLAKEKAFSANDWPVRRLI